MNKPKCTHCPGTTFEACHEFVDNVPHPVTFVICSSCGVVAGMVVLECQTHIHHRPPTETAES